MQATFQDTQENNMGKKIEHCGDAEATEYNHKAVKASVSTSKSRQVETDYSIPSKKPKGE